MCAFCICICVCIISFSRLGCGWGVHQRLFACLSSILLAWCVICEVSCWCACIVLYRIVSYRFVFDLICFHSFVRSFVRSRGKETHPVVSLAADESIDSQPTSRSVVSLPSRSFLRSFVSSLFLLVTYSLLTRHSRFSSSSSSSRSPDIVSFRFVSSRFCSTLAPGGSAAAAPVRPETRRS